METVEQKRTVVKLKLAEQHKLTNYVLEKYVESRKTDAEFAKEAMAVLGFTITGGNVAGVRGAFEIAANNNPGGSGSKPNAVLEARVAALEVKVKVLVAFAQQSATHAGLHFSVGQMQL